MNESYIIDEILTTKIQKIQEVSRKITVYRIKLVKKCTDTKYNNNNDNYNKLRLYR